MTVRRWGGVIALGITSLLVACSDERQPGPRTDDHVATVRAAATETLQQGSAHVLVSGTPTSDGGGSADFAQPRGELVVDRPGGEPQRVAIDGLDMYFRGGFFPPEVTLPSRPWVTTRADELAQILGRDGLWLGQVAQPPALQLHFLSGTTRAERTGTEDLNGVTTERYDLRVDLRDAVDKASGEWREPLFDFLVRAIRFGAGDVIEMAVWIDPQGLIRKVDAIVEYKPAAGVLHLEYAFEDFGSASDVSVPRANQTTPLEVVWRRVMRQAESGS